MCEPNVNFAELRSLNEGDDDVAEVHLTLEELNERRNQLYYQFGIQSATCQQCLELKKIMLRQKIASGDSRSTHLKVGGKHHSACCFGVGTAALFAAQQPGLSDDHVAYLQELAGMHLAAASSHDWLPVFYAGAWPALNACLIGSGCFLNLNSQRIFAMKYLQNILQHFPAFMSLFSRILLFIGRRPLSPSFDTQPSADC